MLKRFDTDPGLTPQHAGLDTNPGIRCAHCRAIVTDGGQRIDVSGSHTHVCTNPRQITFEIGCFRMAPGCRYRGEATMEHTWFQGYGWRITTCAGCGSHLGWFFSSSQGNFHGLILAQLIED